MCPVACWENRKWLNSSHSKFCHTIMTTTADIACILIYCCTQWWHVLVLMHDFACIHVCSITCRHLKLGVSDWQPPFHMQSCSNQFPHVIALHNHYSDVEDGLSFSKGDIVHILSNDDGDWLYAYSKSSAKKGFVPRKYVLEHSESYEYVQISYQISKHALFMLCRRYLQGEGKGYNFYVFFSASKYPQNV